MVDQLKHDARLESTPIRSSVECVRDDASAVALPDGVPIDGVACRGARAMLGVSQVALAEAAECGRNLLNDFENGVRAPRPGNAVRIREALEELGAVFLGCEGRIVVGVDPEVASKRTPRARALGSVHGVSEGRRTVEPDRP